MNTEEQKEMDQDIQNCLVPQEIEQNYIEKTFWNLRSLLRQAKKLTQEAQVDADKKIAAQLTQMHQNKEELINLSFSWFETQTLDLASLATEILEFLARNSRKYFGQTWITKTQILCVLSIVDIISEHKVVLNKQSEESLLSLSVDYASLKMLHFVQRRQGHKTLNRITESFFDGIVEIVSQNLSKNDFLSIECQPSYIISHKALTYELNTQQIIEENRSLNETLKLIKSKVIGKKKYQELSLDEESFLSILKAHLYFILGDAEDKKVAYNLYFFKDNSNSADNQIRFGVCQNKIVQILAETKDVATAVSILDGLMNLSIKTSFIGCDQEDLAEDEFNYEKALLYRIVVQLHSIHNIVLGDQSDNEQISAFDDTVPEVRVIQQVKQGPIQQSVILDVKIQKKICEWIQALYRIREQSGERERLGRMSKEFQLCIQIFNLQVLKIQKPIFEVRDQVILDHEFTVYASSSKYMSQRWMTLDASHQQNLATFIVFVKQTFEMLGKKVMQVSEGRLVEVKQEFVAITVARLLKRLEFKQNSDRMMMRNEEQSFLQFGQRLSESQIIQTLLPALIKNLEQSDASNTSDFLLLSLISLLTKIMDNQETLISVFLNTDNDKSVLRQLFTQLDKKIPQTSSGSLDCLTILIDFISIVQRVNVGEEFVRNNGGSELIQKAIQSKLSSTPQYLLGRRVLPNSQNLNMPAIIELKKKLPPAFQHIQNFFNSSLQQLDQLSAQICLKYINLMQRSGLDESHVANLLSNDDDALKLQVHAQFLRSFASDKEVDDNYYAFVNQSENFLKNNFEIDMTTYRVLVTFQNISLINKDLWSNKLQRLFSHVLEDSDTVVFDESKVKHVLCHLKKCIQDLNNFTNLRLENASCIESFNEASHVTESLKTMQGIDRSTEQGRRLELKLRLKILGSYSKLASSLKPQMQKVLGRVDNTEIIKLLSRISALLQRRNVQLLVEVFKGESEIGQKLQIEHSKTIKELKEKISFDLEAQANWLKPVKTIQDSLLKFINDEYGVNIKESQDQRLLQLILSACRNQDPRNAVAISDQETMRSNLMSMGCQCAQFCQELKTLNVDSEDFINNLANNSGILLTMLSFFQNQEKLINGSLLVAFWKEGGIITLCQYYLNLLKCGDQVTEPSCEEDKTSMIKALGRGILFQQIEIVAQFLTTLLKCPTDHKAYRGINFTNDCKPLELTNLQHFLSNYYNQFLTQILFREELSLNQILLKKKNKIKDQVVETLVGLLADKFRSVFDNSQPENDRANSIALQFANAGVGLDYAGLIARQPRRQPDALGNNRQHVEREPNPAHIQQLVEMGFDTGSADAALRMTADDPRAPQSAMEILFNSPEQIMDFITQRSTRKEFEKQQKEEEELARALKMSEGNIQDDVLVTKEEFQEIVNKKASQLFENLLKTNDNTLISSTQAIKFVQKLSAFMKAHEIDGIWSLLIQSFKELYSKLSESNGHEVNKLLDQEIVFKLHQQLQVYLQFLQKNKNNEDKALSLSDIVNMGLCLLKLIQGSDIAQQCLFNLQLVLLQTIQVQSDSMQDYLIEVIKNPLILRSTLNLTLLIGCKMMNKDYAQQYVATFNHLIPIGDQITQQLITIIINMSAVDEQQRSQICIQALQSSFLNVASLRESLLIEQDKELPKDQNGQVSSEITQFKLQDMLSYLMRITKKEDVLAANFEEHCTIIQKAQSKETTVQMKQQLFSELKKLDHYQPQFSFTHFIQQKEKLQDFIPLAYLEQLKRASNHQIDVFQEILSTLKTCTEFRLAKLSQFSKISVPIQLEHIQQHLEMSQDELNKLQSSARDNLLSILQTVASLTQVSPDLIVLLQKIFQTKFSRNFSTWLVHDFFTSLMGSLNMAKEDSTIKIHTKFTDSFMQDFALTLQQLTSMNSLQNLEQKVLKYDLRCQILKSATEVLSQVKLSNDIESKAKILSALFVVRYLIEKTNFNETLNPSENQLFSTLFIVQQTEFVQDLQENFNNESQMFDPKEDGFCEQIIKLSIECLEIICKNIEDWKSQKVQAKKIQNLEQLNQNSGGQNQVEQIEQPLVFQLPTVIIEQQILIDDPLMVINAEELDDDSESDEEDQDQDDEDDDNMQHDDEGEQHFIDESEDEMEEEQDMDNDVFGVEQMQNLDSSDDEPVIENRFQVQVGGGVRQEQQRNLSSVEQQAQRLLNQLREQPSNSIPDNLRRQSIMILERERFELMQVLDRYPGHAQMPGSNGQNADQVFRCLETPDSKLYNSLIKKILTLFNESKDKQKLQITQISFFGQQNRSNSSSDAQEDFILQQLQNHPAFRNAPQEERMMIARQFMTDRNRARGRFGDEEEEEQEIRQADYAWVPPQTAEQINVQSNQSLSDRIVRNFTERGLIIQPLVPQIVVPVQSQNEEMKNSSEQQSHDSIIAGSPRIQEQQMLQQNQESSQDSLLIQGNAIHLENLPENDVQPMEIDQEVVVLNQAIVGVPLQAVAQVDAPVMIEENKEQEPMTYGFPNSVLIAHGIDPEILEYLPEDMRAEQLSIVHWQPQLQANNNNNNQVNNGGVEGVDQEFWNALPPEIRRELEEEQARNNQRQAQPIVEDSLANILATIIDPRVRLEALQGLSPEQIATLPEGLRAEALQAARRRAVEMEAVDREMQRREQMRIALARQRELIDRGQGPEAFQMRDPMMAFEELVYQEEQKKGELKVYENFKNDPDLLLAPNQVYSFISKHKVLWKTNVDLPEIKKIKELCGSQCEKLMQKDQTSVLGLVCLLFKSTILKKDGKPTQLSFLSNILPVLGSLMQLRSDNNGPHSNRIRIVNCLTTLLSEQLQNDDRLLRALTNQKGDQDMERKLNPVQILFIVGVINQLAEVNRNFVVHILKQFLFKESGFVKNNLQNCLSLQTQQPKSPLLIEILEFMKMAKSQKNPQNKFIIRPLQTVMTSVFGVFDQIIDEIVGHHKFQINVNQIDVIIEAIKLQDTDAGLLQSFAKVLMHLAGNNQELWDAINKKCQKDANSILNEVNTKLTQIQQIFADFKPDAPQNRDESQMLNDLTLQRNMSQNSEVEELIRKKTIMQGDEKSLQNMLQEQSEGLNELRNFILLYFHMMPKEENQDEKSTLIRSSILKFYESKELTDYILLLTDVLQIVNGANTQKDLISLVKNNIVCVFESYFPALLEALAQQDKDSGSQTVKMKPLLAGTQEIDRYSAIFPQLNHVSDRLNLFARFCVKNKKLINKLITSKPSDDQMLQDIIKLVPNIIDFENKKNYFRKELQKVKTDRGGQRLTLKIKRENIFQDAYRQLNHLNPKELRQKLEIQFEKEKGVDGGGLTKDFFVELSKSMFNPLYTLFTQSDNKSSYKIATNSYVNDDHLSFFKFVGRIIGKALVDRQLMQVHFTSPLYKVLLGQSLSFLDLKDQDLQVFNSLKYLKDNPLTYLDEYTFSIDHDYFGRRESQNLCPEGAQISVSEDNKLLYIEKYAYFTIYEQVKDQMDAFKKGFHEVVPSEIIKIFSPNELELLIAGLPNFDVEDFRNNIMLEGYEPGSQVIRWLFEILEDFNREEKDLIGKFLQFVTGSSGIPVGGFKDLVPSKITIKKVSVESFQRFPVSHTCFNTLEMPDYPTKQLLVEKLKHAIEQRDFGII